MRAPALAALLALAACSGGPEVADWQVNAANAMHAFQQSYLAGDTAAAEADFQIVRSNIARTGREDLMARAELARCAALVASLELDGCPAFEKLRPGARAEDIAYFDYLYGKGAHKATDEPLSRLVSAAVQLRAQTISPAAIAQAVEIASARGWRRPLLAWLGVQLKRAEAAGDSEAAARVKRRIGLVSG